jgi:hypothetical protein
MGEDAIQEEEDKGSNAHFLNNARQSMAAVRRERGGGDKISSFAFHESYYFRR